MSLTIRDQDEYTTAGDAVPTSADLLLSFGLPGTAATFSSAAAHLFAERTIGGSITEKARLTGPVRFVSKLLETWELQLDSAVSLLGLGSLSDAEDVLAGQSALNGRDAEDRIVHLFQIRKTLSALFRNADVENEWLREPHAMLNNESPMSLLLEGSMENLLLVREYVETAAGR